MHTPTSADLMNLILDLVQHVLLASNLPYERGDRLRHPIELQRCDGLRTGREV